MLLIKKGRNCSRGSEMVKKHLKTLAAPVSWPVKRKETKFLVRPTPGKKFDLSMPLVLIFKNILKYCKTTAEVKTLLRENIVLVDGKRSTELKFLVGLSDVLSIPLLNESFRMMLNKNGKLQLIKVDKEEADTKICKIIGKNMQKKGVIQLNLSDGRNILVKKDTYKVRDSLLIKLPTQEIKEHIKFEDGSYAFLIGGKHIGEHGRLSKIIKNLAVIDIKGEKFETPVDYVYIVGKDKPLMKMIE
jgi:small subunit ribosomal protein S4e